MFRKKTPNVLHQIKDLIRSPIFVEMPGLILLKDKNSVYLGANQNFVEITGTYSIENLIGKTDQDLPWKEQSHVIRQNDLKVLETGQSLQSEEIIPTSDSVKVFITLRKPLKNKEGEILGLVANLVDITWMKTLAHQLQQDKKRIENEKNIAISYLNNVVACTPGNLYWKDIDGCYLGANQFFLEVAGLSSLADLLGKTDRDLPWHEQYGELRKNDLYVMQTGKSINTEETVILPEENQKTFMAAKMPLRDIEGKIIGIVGNSLDITQQKEIERDCKIAQEKSEMANRAKTKFLEDMRHDFRTPFSGILGMASILYETEVNQDRKDTLKNIVESAQVLLEQLNEITNFISIEEGEFSVVEKQFDLHKLLVDIENLLLPSAKTKNMKLIVKTKTPRYVIGDLMRTQRILMNLLTNAIKFTDTGSIEVESSLASENQKSAIIKFKIKDTGVGISQEEQNSIFEKFSRLTPSYKGIHPGKGLGLRIVKQFLDELDGEIHLISTPKKGSTFIVLIPYKLPLLNCDEMELLVEDADESIK